MATDGIVARFNSVAYSAGDERLLDSVLHGPGPASAPFSARSGRRVNGSGLQVSVGGSPEAWSVTPGAGTIFDSANAAAGGWRYAISSAKSAALPARPGSGTTRIDYLIARIYDTDVLGSGPRELKIEHVAGTAGSPGTPPDMTSRPLSHILATLTVPATGPISISQSSARAVAAGGILPVATTDEMVKLKTDGIAYEGMFVDVAQVERLYRYDGTDFIAVQNQGYAPVSTPTVGGSDSPGTNPIIRLLHYGSTPTDGFGRIAVGFPTPFPNGILHVLPVTIGGTSVAPVVDNGTISKTGVTLLWPGVISANVKFTYEAVGW